MPNLTGQGVYQKGDGGNTRARPPNAEEMRLWKRILARPCVLLARFGNCRGRTTIHHCGTRRGGRKNHKYVLGLCQGHHQGPEGIDGKRMSTKAWESKYGREIDLFEAQQKELGEI